MLGISNDAWLSSGTIIGAIGTIAVPIGGWLVSTVRARHVAELSSIAKSCKDDVDKARADTASVSKDLLSLIAAAQKQDDLLAASLKAAWVQIDDLRINGARRQDQDKLREEFRADIKALGDRLEIAIGALRDDIHRNGGA